MSPGNAYSERTFSVPHFSFSSFSHIPGLPAVQSPHRLDKIRIRLGLALPNRRRAARRARTANRKCRLFRLERRLVKRRRTRAPRRESRNKRARRAQYRGRFERRLAKRRARTPRPIRKKRARRAHCRVRLAYTEHSDVLSLLLFFGHFGMPSFERVPVEHIHRVIR